MTRIRRILVWLGRIHRCRGFGVQSPWAYDMVRYVINEHWPYYAYGPLRREYPQTGGVGRKLLELCLRLANRVQPAAALLHGVDAAMFGAYIQAGCRRTRLSVGADECVAQAGGRAFMAVIAPCGDFGGAYRAVADGASDGSVAVLIGIHGSKPMRRLWRKVVAGRQGVVTFDLYWCGLVCFDKKRYKQNYIINF